MVWNVFHGSHILGIVNSGTRRGAKYDANEFFRLGDPDEKTGQRAIRTLTVTPCATASIKARFRVGWEDPRVDG